MSQSRACILLVDQDREAQKTAVRECGRNGMGSKDLASQPFTRTLMEGRPFALAVQVKRMWQPGKTLRVKFIGGTPYMRKKVQQYAPLWTEYANIRFTFVEDHEAADIRVAFEPGASYSSLGTDALRKKPEEHTMNFGWFDDNTPDEEFSRTVLHEFGHALGCVHEHQQPHARINWNKEFVYRFHEQEVGWDRNDVDWNLFRFYDHTKHGVQGTEFDSESIMAYPIPPEWTLDGMWIPHNDRLSTKDIAAIRDMYPHNMRLETGIFDASKALPSDAHDQMAHAHGTIQFAHPNRSPPTVLLGLNWLGLNVPRINGHVQEVTGASARIDLESWVGSTRHSSGCAWLTIPSDDNDIQFGRFKSSNLSSSNLSSSNQSSSSRVVFARPYPAPPEVVVWLESFDAVSNSFRGLFVKASDITDHGFTITITSLRDTTLYSAGAVWLAYSSGRRDIRSGVFGSTDFRAPQRNTTGLRGWSLVQYWVKYRNGLPDTPLTPTTAMNGWVAFDSPCFTVAPRLFTAFNWLDTRKPMRETSPRIRVDDGHTTKGGFHWTLDTPLNTTDYEAGVSYIAF